MPTPTSTAHYRRLNAEKRKLPCKLTEREISAYGHRLASIAVERDRLNDEIASLKNQAATLKTSITGLEIESLTKGRAIRTGQEEREVEVETYADMRTGTAYEKRLDTGELVTEPRPLNREESQGVLFEEQLERTKAAYAVDVTGKAGYPSLTDGTTVTEGEGDEAKEPVESEAEVEGEEDDA